MRKSEVEVKKNTKKAIASLIANHSLLPGRKKIVSINAKDPFKSVLCAATSFFLFLLHLGSQSFKVVLNFFLSAAPM